MGTFEPWPNAHDAAGRHRIYFFLVDSAPPCFFDDFPVGVDRDSHLIAFDLDMQLKEFLVSLGQFLCLQDFDSASSFSSFSSTLLIFHLSASITLPSALT
jgi:hypothetical protein